MVKAKNPVPVLFYVLIVYVAFQFCWWAYLLVDQYSEISLSNPTLFDESWLNRKSYMIIGEGFVFFVLLVIGFYRVHRSFNKEVRLAKQQKNFLLSITHELKSPLAGIKLNLETLSKRKVTPQQQEKLIGFALKETDRLEGLVENILTTTQFDNDALNLYPESFAPHQTLQEIIENYAQKESHQFDYQPAFIGLVESDKNSFISVVTNLLSNALKYSPDQSTIVVELSENNKHFTLSVSNTGDGIPKADLPFIFNKFYRVGNEDTRKSKGTGLGLYIVKFLSQALGGDAKVSSDGKGTEFSVRFLKKLSA